MANGVRLCFIEIGTLEKFHWWAALGEDPYEKIGPALKTAQESEVGGIRFVPSDVFYRELIGSRRIGTVGVSVSYPFHVSGSSAGYSYNAAMHDATTKLKLMCSLLSLAYGRTLVLRRGPAAYNHLEAAGHKLSLPLPEFSLNFPDSGKEDKYGEPRVVRIPEWVSKAWSLVGSSQRLAQLLVAYHEGLLLSVKDHRSYALLAYVGVVEAIGNTAFKKLPRCPDCKLVQDSGVHLPVGPPGIGPVVLLIQPSGYGIYCCDTCSRCALCNAPATYLLAPPASSTGPTAQAWFASQASPPNSATATSRPTLLITMSPESHRKPEQSDSPTYFRATR